MEFKAEREGGERRQRQGDSNRGGEDVTTGENG